MTDEEKTQKMQQTRAIALEYDGAEGAAPRVTASAKGLLAERLLQIAFENGVRVRQDADLVEILAAVDVDTPIPVEAFAAVAEILAYVYAANDLERWKEP